MGDGTIRRSSETGFRLNENGLQLNATGLQLNEVGLGLGEGGLQLNKNGQDLNHTELSPNNNEIRSKDTELDIKEIIEDSDFGRKLDKADLLSRDRQKFQQTGEASQELVDYMSGAGSFEVSS